MPDDPLWINASAGSPAYAANELRRAFAMLLTQGVGDKFGARSGVHPAGGAAVSLSGTTVTVLNTKAVVYPGLTSTAGPYLVQLLSRTHTLNAPDGSNPRKDLICLRVWDNDEDSLGLRQADTVYVAGTPAASPSEPPVPPSSFRMATIDVPASGGGSATLTYNAPFTVASGGVLPVRNDAELPGSTAGLYDGMVRWNQATNELQVHNGSSTWETVGGGSMPRGIMATPVGTASNGTATSGSTETRDAVLGNYVFTAVAGRRYRVTLSGRGMNVSIANRKYEFRIRDGGSSTPTAGSTLLATGEANLAAASVIGRKTVHVEGTFTAAAGTRTLACFTVATDTADGVCTPVPSSSGRACEFYVEDIGAA